MALRACRPWGFAPTLHQRRSRAVLDPCRWLRTLPMEMRQQGVYSGISRQRDDVLYISSRTRCKGTGQWLNRHEDRDFAQTGLSWQRRSGCLPVGALLAHSEALKCRHERPFALGLLSHLRLGATHTALESALHQCEASLRLLFHHTSEYPPG